MQNFFIYKREFESHENEPSASVTHVNQLIYQSINTLFIHVAPKSIKLDQNTNVYEINRQMMKLLFCFHFCRLVRRDPKPLGKNSVPRGTCQLFIIKRQVWSDANFVPTLCCKQWIFTGWSELLLAVYRKDPVLAMLTDVVDFIFTWKL